MILISIYTFHMYSATIIIKKTEQKNILLLLHDNITIKLENYYYSMFITISKIIDIHIYIFHLKYKIVNIQN